jgi:hypothetical protein
MPANTMPCSSWKHFHASARAAWQHVYFLQGSVQWFPGKVQGWRPVLLFRLTFSRTGFGVSGQVLSPCHVAFLRALVDLLAGFALGLGGLKSWASVRLACELTYRSPPLCSTLLGSFLHFIPTLTHYYNGPLFLIIISLISHLRSLLLHFRHG